MNHKIILFVTLFFIISSFIYSDEIQDALNEYIRDIESLEIPRIDGYTEFETIQKIDSIKVMRHGIRCIPYLLEEDETKRRNGLVSLALGEIYFSVTYINLSESYYPWSGAYYTLEWYGGKELAKERFNLLYNKLKNSDKKIVL